MAQRKFRFRPEPPAQAQTRPRVSHDYDGFVASPVHAMQRNLWVFAQTPAETPIKLYPGWVRLAVPLIGSGALWGIILWTLGYLA